MGVTVDCYLRDQIIRGELAGGRDRPLDQLNTSIEGFIILHNACLQNLRASVEPVQLGTTRVQKSQLLLVVPHDTQAVAPQLRPGWVRKARVRVVAGIGPLTVRGTFHVPPAEHVSLEKIIRDSDGRAFLPMTRASITSLQYPDWSIEVPSAFLPRQEVCYISIEEISDEAENSDTPLTEDVYRRLLTQLGPTLGSRAIADHRRFGR